MSDTTTVLQVRAYAGDGSLPMTLRSGLDDQGQAVLVGVGQAVRFSRPELEQIGAELLRRYALLPWYKRLRSRNRPAGRVNSDAGWIYVYATSERQLRLLLPIEVTAHLNWKPLPGFEQKSAEDIKLNVSTNLSALRETWDWAQARLEAVARIEAQVETLEGRVDALESARGLAHG